MSVVRSVLAVAAVAAFPLRAQVARTTLSLPPEVITATRDPSLRRDATSTATVLDGAMLRAEGVTTLAEALRRVPGLAIARTSSFGSPTSVFLRGGQSNYVRVLLDGVPLNEPGGVVDLGRIGLDDVERIEVLRGPASVLYGSEAVAGVIQIFTRRAAGERTVRAEVGGGSYGGRRALAAASGAVRGVGLALTGEHVASDGSLPYNNGYRNEMLVATVAAGEGSASDVRLTVRHGTSTYRYPTGSSGALEDRDAARTERRAIAGVDAGHRWSASHETRLSLATSELRPRTRDGSDDAADTTGFYGYHSTSVIARRTVDLRHLVRRAGASLAVGGEWGRETERSASLTESEFGEFTDAFRAARETRALYAQVEGERGRLTIRGGARLDDNSAFGTFRTARLGAAWRLGVGTRVRVSAGNAFKAPSFFENFATGFTVGNAALRPERARSADIGVETILGSVALVRVTGFAQGFRDLIQYTGAPPSPGAPNYYNVAAADAGGVEVDVTLPDVRGVRVDVAHTWTETRVTDAGFDSGASATFVEGEALLRRPRHVVSLGAARGLGRLGSLSARVTRVGERADRDFASSPATPVMMPAYTTLDLGAELAPGGLRARGMSLQVRVENATGARFQQVAGFDAPGRSLFASLNLRR